MIERYQMFAREWREDYETGRNARPFQWYVFKVLIITKSKKRLRNMLARQQAMCGGGSSRYLFTTEKEFSLCNDFLTLKWINGKGNTVTLLNGGDEPPQQAARVHSQRDQLNLIPA